MRHAPLSLDTAHVQTPVKTPKLPSSMESRRGFLKVLFAAVIGGALFSELCVMAEDELGRPLTEEEKHHLKEVEKLINEKWEAQNETYEKIAKEGFQKHYESLPDKEGAFFTKEQIAAGKGKCECCSDEGNCDYENGETHTNMMLVRVPGSGILQALEREDQDPFADDFLTQVAQEALDAEVTVFTTHKGCGAFKAVYNSWLQKQGKPEATQEVLNAKAAEWAKAVAGRMKKLVAPGQADAIRHDFIETLKRPEEIHVARCLYLTDLDEFNAGYRGLPQGFVERTGKKGDLSKILNHADILRKIAFDKKHAFGGKFSSKPSEQFVICCVTDDPERLKMLIEKAQAAVAGLDKEAQAKIRVEGLLKK